MLKRNIFKKIEPIIRNFQRNGKIYTNERFVNLRTEKLNSRIWEYLMFRKLVTGQIYCLDSRSGLVNTTKWLFV